MSMLSDMFAGEKQPHARDQWTRSQRRELFGPLTNQFGADIRQMFDTGQNPYAYAGPYSTGPSALQQEYFGMAPQVAQQQMQGLQGIAGGQAPLDDMYNYGQRYANDVITPNVMERFGGMGTANSGGAMQGLSRELGTYGLGMQSQIGQMSMQNQAQRMQALGMMGRVPDQLGQAGSQQWGVAQQGIQGNIAQNQAMNPYNSGAVNRGMGMLGFRITPQGQAAGAGYNAVGEGVAGLVDMGFKAGSSMLGGMLPG